MTDAPLANPKTGLKLLTLSETPAAQTGSGRVMSNLLKQVAHLFDSVDVFAINCMGQPHDLPYRIWDAGGEDWYSQINLNRFLQLLREGGFTHVLLVRDLYYFAPNWFSNQLYNICSQLRIKSYLYFTTDSPVHPKWATVLHKVDFPIACCRFGKEQALLACDHDKPKISVLPHGVDTTVYRPLEDRKGCRARLDWKHLKDDDFLIVSVNANQHRKGHTQTMDIFARLKALGLPVKLLMHMPSKNIREGHNLMDIAEQFGLVYGKDWIHSDRFFNGSHLPRVNEVGLNEIYNASNLFITTSLGEGFGLTILEAVAAGSMVAVPDNTNCAEIIDAMRLHGRNGWLKMKLLDQPIGTGQHDYVRLRYPVNCKVAAQDIAAQIKRWKVAVGPDHAMPIGLANEYDWNRIGEKWQELLLRDKPVACLPAWEAEREHAKSIGQPLLSYDECLKPQPSVLEQLDCECGFFDTVWENDCVEFNCGYVVNGDKRFMVVRISGSNPGDSTESYLYVRPVHADMSTVASEGFPLRPPNWQTHNHEDPRIFFCKGTYFVSYISWPKAGPVHCKQLISLFDSTWKHLATVQIPFGENGPGPGMEKNWCFFIDGNDMMFVYSFSPHRIVRFAGGKQIVESCSHMIPKWQYGEIRGGTPPIKISETEYLSFFHSSIPWNGVKKRYVAGCYTFSTQAPHRILRMTQEPLLLGSEADERKLPGSPLVVFPCGAVLDEVQIDGTWHDVITMTAGINDERCAWFKIPLAQLNELMKPV